MSSFLTGVETEEDFRNTLRDGINAISKTTKPHPPSRKRGLEDDDGQLPDSSPHRRPKKQHKPSSDAASRVRRTNGQLEWLDEADAQWKPAGYHRDHRAQLLALSASQPGADPWTPALGTNVTSFSPLTRGWTENPNSVLDSKGRRVLEMETSPIDWVKEPRYGHLTFNGLIMLDLKNRAVKDIPGLPLTLSTKSDGWLLEGLRRCTKIETKDFVARFPKRIGENPLVQRMNRWIKRKSIPNWKPRHHPSTPSTDTPKRNRKTIKKRKSAAVTPDGEESTTPSEDSSPIIPQMQSSYLNVGSPGQEWPLSPDTFSQSTCAYDAPYSQSTVGNSVSPPWNAEPSANDVPHSSYPIMQQIQLGSLDDGSSGHEWPPSRAASSQSTCGSYPIMQQIQSGSLDDGSSGHEWPPSPAASSQLTCGSYPIMQQIQSGSLDDGFSGHEWPPSPAASSQSTCGYGAAYQSAVGSSALPPWDVVSSANCGRSVLQSDRGPRYGEGHYAYAPESSCYSQSVMPESANFQPLRDIESESQESLFSKRDFYSASPTNLVESNFVWSMLEYTRSHYRSVMSREPPVTTFGATYTCQYNELQDHVKQLWPYSNPPPDLRAIAPISTMSYRTM